ncbi:MAG: zinc-ribbon domain-containing protein [Methanomicrobiales archaeon]
MEQKEIICPGCEAVLDSGVKFCTSCGFKIQSDDLENICVNCGTLNVENAKFCEECGLNLNESKFSDYYYEKSAPQRKGLIQKLFEDTGKTLENAKQDISKAITDYTHAAEAETLETYRSIIVKVELPRIKKEDIEVNITPRTVKIKASFDQDINSDQGHQIKLKTRKRGQINKTINLPKEVVPEKAESEFKNHFLIIELPKAEIEKSYKLDI